MSEYISRNEAHQKLHEARCCDMTDKWGQGYNSGLTEAIDIIDNISSADVSPVVHGHWIDKTEWHGNIGFCCYECSNCGYVRDNKPKSRGDGRGCNFCDDCGAKMDEEEEK